MIKILIQGREIELPADISFEYTAENRLFTNADGYSFDIEIPLKESRVNTEIFGMIFDPQADIYKVRFDAMIITTQVTLSGCMAVVGVNESTISLQFLEGESARNANIDFDETYINDLVLGFIDLKDGGASVADGLASFDDGAKAVALPWVIQDTGENIHNKINYEHSKGFFYTANTRNPMPYLVYVAEAVARAVGLKPDFSQWSESDWRHLVMCNAIPSSLGSGFGDISWRLPHWTVNEFFNNLSDLLGGSFDVDMQRGSVSFEFNVSALANSEPVTLDKVVDEFSVDINSEDDAEQKPQEQNILKNLTYPDNGFRFWKVCSCDWYIRRAKKMQNIGEHTKIQWFIDTVKQFKYSLNKSDGSNTDSPNRLFYVEEVNCYFALHSYNVVKYPGEMPYEDYIAYGLQPNKWYYVNEVLPVNDLGDYIYNDDDDASAIELGFAPAAIDETDEGYALFLPFKQKDYNDTVHDEPDGDNSDSWRQPDQFRNIMAAETERHEFYDKIYVAFWTGLENCAGAWNDVNPETNGYKPAKQRRGIFPDTSNVKVFRDFSWHISSGPDMRLNNGFSRGFSLAETIDAKHLYKFSFISDLLPSPRATFFIKGKRYVCAKLTANFSAAGMSRIIKGEFYRY